jgi:type I restriction enzyme S subunit
MENKLPKGWVESSLEDLLVSLESGSRPKGGVRGIESGVPSIGGEHLNDEGSFDFSKIKYVPESFASEMSRGQIKNGDILIVKDGATTGKTSFVYRNFPYQNAVVNEHVFICRPSREINPKFLFYYLWSKEGKERILENFKGSAQGGINTGFSSNTIIPVAPIEEQRRIVFMLEALFEKIQNNKQRLDTIPQIMKRFRQSILTAAVSGKLTEDWRQVRKETENAETLFRRISSRTRTKLKFPELDSEKIPSTWKRVHLGSLAQLITKGASPSWQGIRYMEDGVLFITSENVGNDCLTLENKKYVQYEFNSIQKRSILQYGDLLTNIVGASIGRTAIFNMSVTANINQAVCLIRLDRELSTNFYSLVLNSPQLIEVMNTQKVDVARANISLYDVNCFPVPLPPFEEQQEIVSRVRYLFDLADKIQVRYLNAKLILDILPNNILSKAFHGELIPQNPDDEPAKVLLDRIKAERDLIKLQLKQKKKQ